MAEGRNAFTGKLEGTFVYHAKEFPGILYRSLLANMGDGNDRAAPEEKVSFFSNNPKMTFPPLEQIVGASNPAAKTAIRDLLESQPRLSREHNANIRQISYQKLFESVEKQFPHEKDVEKIRNAITFAIWSQQQQKEVKDAQTGVKNAGPEPKAAKQG